MLVLDGTEISGSYNITYNGTELKQIDVVKDDSRYTVWKKGGLVIEATDINSSYPIYVEVNGSVAETITVDGTYNLNINKGDTFAIKSSVYTFVSGTYTGSPTKYTVTGSANYYPITWGAYISQSGSKTYEIYYKGNSARPIISSEVVSITPANYTDAVISVDSNWNYSLDVIYATTTSNSINFTVRLTLNSGAQVEWSESNVSTQTETVFYYYDENAFAYDVRRVSV